MANCLGRCGLDDVCVEQCTANASDEAITVFNAILVCVLCEVCAQQCQPGAGVCP